MSWTWVSARVRKLSIRPSGAGSISVALATGNSSVLGASGRAYRPIDRKHRASVRRSRRLWSMFSRAY